ncbi:MAG: Multi-sensor signal transduction histidine kinase [Pedosphaera sp.]|nr:Multi-sensor signal transduction histidine kinase [Pedosphaera sp.]
MKTEAEQVMRLNADAVWADETKAQRNKGNALPGIKGLVLVVALAMLLAVGGSIWAYMSGLEVFRSLAAQIGDNAKAGSSQTVSQLVAQARHWAMVMALASVAGGTGLFAVAVGCGQWLRRNWSKHHLSAKQEADVRAHHLLGQLADSRVSEEEARNAKADLEARLANVMKAHTVLEREINERRLAEKSFAQQTQQLERSKDVLEMHVQARTQEAQKLQRRNELILNSAGDGIFGFDLQGRATFANPSAAKLTGLKPEELMGKTEEAIFFPSKPKGAAKDGPGLLKGADGNYLPEQIFYRKDGSGFPVEYLRTPIKENDKVVGAVVMFKDITERRLAEDKLNRKATELARSNRELEQFAFVASHDLQEPLRKIQAFGDRLKTKCEAVQLEEGRDYLERMQSAAARMQTLINDLLTFSRVISSSQPFVPVDLGAVTQEVLVDLEHRVEKTRAQIEVGILPTIEADATQMRQLLQNLIGNALKFQTPDATPVIKIDAQLINRDQIQEDVVLPSSPVPTSPDDKFCVLTVQDNGIGFEEQYLDKVFAVFQRLHGRSEYEGTGVGLAVCRRITERHGGIITAQSKPGEGSIFIAILPLQQPKVETPQ